MIHEPELDTRFAPSTWRGDWARSRTGTNDVLLRWIVLIGRTFLVISNRNQTNSLSLVLFMRHADLLDARGYHESERRKRVVTSTRWSDWYDALDDHEPEPDKGLVTSMRRADWARARTGARDVSLRHDVPIG